LRTLTDREAKSSTNFSSSVLHEKTEVVQSNNSKQKTSQKRSEKLSQSKLWRLVQVLYGLASIVVIFMSAVAASQPSCTGGSGGGFTFYRTPEVCTEPEPALAAVVALVALVGAISFYYVLQWAVGYVFYGPRPGNS